MKHGQPKAWRRHPSRQFWPGNPCRMDSAGYARSRSLHPAANVPSRKQGWFRRLLGR